MIKYKLLHPNMTSYHRCKWVIGEWKEATGRSNQPLCTDGWLHCYDSPLIAILHNPLHIYIDNPRLFEVEVGGQCLDDYGMKCGYRRMRLIKEIPIPQVTPEHRVRYGILCSRKICDNLYYVSWANRWLSGEDREKESAKAIAEKIVWRNPKEPGSSAVRLAAWNAAKAAEALAVSKSKGLLKELKKWHPDAKSIQLWAMEYAARPAEYISRFSKFDLVKIAEQACNISGSETNNKASY